MRFALDTDGNRVCVDDANKRNKYTCPCCGEELTVRQGRLIGWCFAHKSGSLFFFLPFLAPPSGVGLPSPQTTLPATLFELLNAAQKKDY